VFVLVKENRTYDQVLGDLVYDAWAAWSRHQRFNGPECEEDWAKPALLNRLDWYSAHGWRVAYPGDPKIYLPSPGAGEESAGRRHRVRG
jgi:hypothetical protein